MENLQFENNSTTPAWFNLLSADLSKKRFKEVIEFCAYYPESKDKTILLSYCHFSQKNFNYLQSVDLTTEELESMFRRIGTDKELVLENMIALLEEYIGGNELELEYIIEAYVNFLSPNVSDAFNCVEVYLSRALLMESVALAKKILKINPSIEHHLTYLKSLAKSRKYFEDNHELIIQISVGAEELLKITQKQDFETQLKVAKILMLDSATFQQGKDLFSQCYDYLDAKDDFVSSYLIQLVKTKDYLEKIFALAFEFFPESLPIILSQLYFRYKSTKNKPYFHLAITYFEHTDLYKENSKKAYTEFVTSSIEFDHTTQIVEHLTVLFRIGNSYKEIEKIFYVIKNKSLNVIADASKILDDIRLSGGFNSTEINKLRYIIYLATKEKEPVLADHQIDKIFKSFINFEDFSRFQPVTNFSLQDKLLLSANYWGILKSFGWFEETKIENLIEKCSILDKKNILIVFLNAFNEIDDQSAETIMKIVLSFYLNLDNKAFTEFSEKIESINSPKFRNFLQDGLDNQKFHTLEKASIEGKKFLEQTAILRLLQYCGDVFSDKSYNKLRLYYLSFVQKTTYLASILSAQSWLVNVLLESSTHLNVSQTAKEKLKQFILLVNQLEKAEGDFDLSYQAFYQTIGATTDEYYREISLSIEHSKQQLLASLSDERKRKIMAGYFNWLLLERGNIIETYNQLQIIDLLNKRDGAKVLSGLSLIFEDRMSLKYYSAMEESYELNIYSHNHIIAKKEMLMRDFSIGDFNSDTKFKKKPPIKGGAKNTERHLKVNFPDAVIKEKKAELTIQLTINVPLQSLVVTNHQKCTTSLHQKCTTGKS